MLQLGRPLVVATSSINRIGILKDAGLVFATAVPTADERVTPGETPKAYVERLAAAKARSIMPPSPEHLILTADTCVYLHGNAVPVEITSRKAALRGWLQRLCRWRGRREPLKITRLPPAQKVAGSIPARRAENEVVEARRLFLNT